MGAKRSAEMVAALKAVLSGTLTAAQAAVKHGISKGAISKTPEYKKYREESKK